MEKGKPFVKQREKNHGTSLIDTVNDLPLQKKRDFSPPDGVCAAQDFFQSSINILSLCGCAEH